MRQRDALLSKCVRLGDYAQAAVTGALSAAERSYPASEARGGGWEEQPCARGQGLWPGGATPRTRSGGCVGAGGPRGAIPR